MVALREYKKVKDNKIIIELPKDFDYKEVEVIILPKDECEFWSEDEIERVGEIGFVSNSFEDDGEDYSKW